MNLIAYDKVQESIDKNKTWVDIKYKFIRSREINKRNYYCFSKKYNNFTNTNEFYLIVLDDIPEDRKYYNFEIDNFGRSKFKVSSIWNCSSLHNFEINSNVNISLIEHTDDGDIYLLDV